MTQVSQPETAAQPGFGRPRRFLIAKDSSIDPANVGPVDFDWIVDQLEESPDVKVEAQLQPRSFRAQNLGNSVTDRVVVATMTEEAAEDLVRHPQVIVEEDAFVLPQRAVGIGGAATGLAELDPGLLSPFGVSTSWTLRLVGVGDQPVSGATVYLYGSGVPVQGRTDAQGTVTLSLRNETDATLRALYINPLSDYWSVWQNLPHLVSGATNTVRLQSLSESFPGFPSTEILGWGQRAMRLDHVPPQMTGRGIKVAVVDSGAAALTHPDLNAIHDGVDLTSDTHNDTQWRDDTIAHGSHCSGIIAGAHNGGGIRGFAPDAQMYEARIFPGGRISSLLDALDYCIDQDIDVVNMSLGTGGVSQIMLQKITQAKTLGIACIVAAGNTGGPVQFPGTSPDVLTVAAMGQEGSFPDTSYHAQQRWASGQHTDSYFSAQFSCHGAEVDVCGPGVAVVSSVPPNGYASWDGTSMATPHITGLAALVLAHHPDFQAGGLNLRVDARVDHLFRILQDSATGMNFGDPQRSGKGLPDAPRALGLEPNPNQASVQDAQTAAIKTSLAHLAQEMVNAGLLVETLAVDPAFVARIFDFNNTPLGQMFGFKRGLAEIAAQLRNAGLSTEPHPTPVPATVTTEPALVG